jgi:hypothetical protein
MFADSREASWVAKSENWAGNRRAFLNKDPERIAAFLSEPCLDYERCDAPDIDPYFTRETLQQMGLHNDCVDAYIFVRL